MNKVYYILIFTILCVTGAINCYAQASRLDSSASLASISQSNIYAKSVGKGATKEEAEQAAYTSAILQIIKEINELSPEKVKVMWQGYNPPITNIRSWGSDNDGIFDEGVNEIALDKSLIHGYWEYSNGEYTYILRITIQFYLTEAEKSSSNN